jgi:hypothetical protein
MTAHTLADIRRRALSSLIPPLSSAGARWVSALPLRYGRICIGSAALGGGFAGLAGAWPGCKAARLHEALKQPARLGSRPGECAIKPISRVETRSWFAFW